MNTRVFILLALFFCFGETNAQDYSVIYTHPNSVGQPGQLFLSQVKVQNSSSEGIFMHYERIVNNLPGTWTSCFCYPFCIAPWIDSATFYVNGFSTDSIMPNFGTDSIPAMATVTIVLYQVGYENMPDTITFTGSTLGSGLIDESPVFSISTFPNPFTDFVTVTADVNESVTLSVFNVAGALVYEQQVFIAQESRIDLSFLHPGIYWMRIGTQSSQSGTSRIVKIQ